MKIITKSDIASLVKDNDTICISGSGGSGSPEELIRGIKESFELFNHPKNITVSCGISPGNLTLDENVGMNMLATPGLVGKAICAHLGMGKVFGNAIGNNMFPAYALPLGVINHLYRAQAGNEDGIITHIGLNTFADPRIDGCRANEAAKNLEPIVELININGKENLLYKTFPINVALLKATYADEDGNISLEHEAVIGEQYNMAHAAHNSGGIVIVQVEEIKSKNSLKARNVLLHSSIVDYVLVAAPDKSLGEYNIPIYKPELTGESRIELDDIPIRELDERKICGRRSAMEISKGDVINLGVGMPDSVANVAAEEGFANDIYLSVESGSTGGVPTGGVAFGATINPDIIVSTSQQFDTYNGGYLNMAIVGLAQVDKHGNVNVSKFGTRVTGPGGFINITQSTNKIVFMGTFTTKNLNVEIKNNELKIINEGENKKFIDHVEQITFSGKQAFINNQTVLYVTERAVFKLIEDGIELIEIAPGVDLVNDILNQMDFVPSISSELKVMDSKIFNPKIMNLKI